MASSLRILGSIRIEPLVFTLWDVFAARKDALRMMEHGSSRGNGISRMRSFVGIHVIDGNLANRYGLRQAALVGPLRLIVRARSACI